MKREETNWLVLGRHEEHRLDLRVEARVHAGHLEFVFEVGNGAQAPDDEMGAHVLDEMHQQLVEGLHLDLAAVEAVLRVGDLWRIRSMRSSTLSSGPFPALVETATISLSAMTEARWMMSICPVVTGSKVPG